MKNEKEKKYLNFLIPLLVTAVLIPLYLYISSKHKGESASFDSEIFTLILQTIPSMLAVLIGGLFYYVFITKPGLIVEDEIVAENLVCQFQEPKHNCQFIENSGNIFDTPPLPLQDLDSIFKHYLSLENNTLDYIAYVEIEKEDSKVSIAPDFQRRMEQFGLSKEKTRGGQLKLYDTLSTSMHEMVDEVNDTFKELDQGVLFRVIYDVKKGGIFYYHIEDGTYLFIATLDQSSMDDGSAEAEVQSIKSTVKLWRK